MCGFSPLYAKVEFQMKPLITRYLNNVEIGHSLCVTDLWKIITYTFHESLLVHTHYFFSFSLLAPVVQTLII